MSTTLSATTSAASNPSSASAASSSGPSALGSLTANYQTFLTMLTTQLKNQDPTSPMDSSQFTTELVQFSGVEQQINTNTNLSQLIQLTQGATVLQSSQILGKKVEATSDHLPLQQGQAAVNFTSTSAQPVAVSVYDSAGHALYNTTVAAKQGANTVSWNGQNGSGLTQPDGSYGVTVSSVAPDGSLTAMPFTVVGTATSVQEQGSSVLVQLGAVPVNMTAVKSVTN
jgi:flagellar basal-body rod modification protein FlgD